MSQNGYFQHMRMWNRWKTALILSMQRGTVWLAPKLQTFQTFTEVSLWITLKHVKLTRMRRTVPARNTCMYCIFYLLYIYLNFRSDPQATESPYYPTWGHERPFGGHWITVMPYYRFQLRGDLLSAISFKGTYISGRNLGKRSFRMWPFCNMSF